jgi:glyoxylase-like metal-dependent hydrolase (beta-lactamase superfamily II)
MIIERIVVGEFFTNCYIIGCSKEKVCGIIDPGSEGEKIKKIVEIKNLKPIMIINTHGHFDHIGSNNFFNLPVYIHKNDLEFLSNPEKNLSSLFSIPYLCKNEVFVIEEKDIIKIGELNLEVLSTPGHTPGSICLKIQNVLFTGDTIFADGIGRTDFPEGDEEELKNSIKTKILSLPDETIIYPGHGEYSKIKYFKNLFYKWTQL